MAEYVATLDQGTTSTRCILFDRKGGIAGSDQKEHQQIYPYRAGPSMTPPRSGSAGRK